MREPLVQDRQKRVEERADDAQQQADGVLVLQRPPRRHHQRTGDGATHGYQVHALDAVMSDDPPEDHQVDAEGGLADDGDGG